MDALRDATRALARTRTEGSGVLVSRVRSWIADPDPASLAAARDASDALGDRLDSGQRLGRPPRRARARRAPGAGLGRAGSSGSAAWYGATASSSARVTEAQLVMAGERRLMALVQNSADMVAVLEPDSTMTFVSPASVAVLGRTPEDLTGHKLAHQLNMADMPVFIGQLAASREGDQRVMLRVAHADRRELVLEGTLTNLMSEPAVNGWVLTLRDVTDRLAMQEEL